MNEKEYTKLKYLLSCYFHQDMDAEYKNVEEALKAYVYETANSFIISALNDIQNLKFKHLDSEELWNFIGKLGCEYRYQEYYNIPEKWLDYISDTIKKYLVEKESIEQMEQNGM